MISTNDLKNGITIEVEGAIYVVMAAIKNMKIISLIIMINIFISHHSRPGFPRRFLLQYLPKLPYLKFYFYYSAQKQYA